MYFSDLHVHTSLSDCSEDVPQIIQRAKAVGLTHISFTDHDTTKLSGEHVRMAQNAGIRAIAGIELSACDGESGVKAHILGFGYTGTSHIEAIGAETLRKRNENCLKQMEILKQLDYRIDEEKIKAKSAGCIYKQHILQYLYETEQTDAVLGDVYHNIFKNGGPCDFDIEYPQPEDCVRAICRDGGTAVLAHPGQQDNFFMLPLLTDAGLKGIEYRHPSHGEEDRRKVQRAALEFSLIMTGGSDYHGAYGKTKTTPGEYPAHPSSEILFL